MVLDARVPRIDGVAVRSSAVCGSISSVTARRVADESLARITGRMLP
jgi:hypothetical protein